MTGKPKYTGRLESEIEKNREESNWKKVSELADQLFQRSPECISLANFLNGESKLELYLEDHQPNESNISKARNGLSEAKKLLMSSMDEQGSKLGLVTDAYLLIAKLHFAMGIYDEALKNLSTAGIDDLTEKSLPNRILRVVAESFAVKGFCLEKIPLQSTSKFKVKEREEQIIKCFEKAGNLCLLYLQELDRSRLGPSGTLNHTSALITTTGSSSPLPTSFFEQRIGYILESALQKAPIIHINNGNVQRAIDQYRSMLSTVESTSTQSLRLTLTRQLAQVLLRGVSGEFYIPPDINDDRKKIEISGSPWKPRKYNGIHLFCPAKDIEEILLLLMISEAMAVRNAVLDRSPEIKEARNLSHNNTTAVYDLLTISLCRLQQTSLLSESFEKAMKFAFEDFHIWFQFALSLIGSGKYQRAEQLLHGCSKLNPTNSHPCLLAAKLCYEHLGLIDKGIEYSVQALEREKSNSQGLLARCFLSEAIGYSLKSSQTYIQKEQQKLVNKAIESLQKAQSLDPNDHLIEFYLAFHYAQARQIQDAIQRVKIALHICSEHIPSLHLLALLLSAQKQYEQALDLIDFAIDEYPDNLSLLYTKAHLETVCNGTEDALLTSKEMLHVWKSLYENNTKSESERELVPVSSETRSVLNFQSDKSEYDTSSLHAGSVSATKIEQTLSEVASTLSSFQPKPGPQNEWLLQVHIWLLVAELYVDMGDVSEAISCVHEASSIYPLSHHVMFLKGLIHEHRQEFHEAKVNYQNAISINPLHIKSLQHLGLVYHYLGNDNLSEKTLRDAAKIDPMAHKTWYNLGKVLSNMGNYEPASDCLSTAIELESTSPILPFTVVQRSFE